jgi:hypothetical protein
MATFDRKDTVPTADSTNNYTVMDVVGNKTDTVSGTSVVSLVKVVDTVVDGIAAANTSGDSSGSFSYLDAGSEQDVIELATTTRKVVNGIWLDLVNMTQNGTIKVYYKIDGTNYRLFSTTEFTVATDADGVYININAGITNALKVTYTEGADETADRAIPYSIIYRTIE